MNSKRKVQEIVKECIEEEIVGEKVIKRSVRKYTWKYEGNNDAGNTLKDFEDAREAKAPKRTKVDGENVEDAREAEVPKRTKVDGENVEDAREAKVPKRPKVDGENVEDAREAKVIKRSKADGENVEDAREAKTPKQTKKTSFVKLEEEIVTGFDRGLEPDKIIDHAKISYNEYLFWMKWKGSDEVDIVPFSFLSPWKYNCTLIYDYFTEGFCV